MTRKRKRTSFERRRRKRLRQEMILLLATTETYVSLSFIECFPSTLLESMCRRSTLIPKKLLFIALNRPQLYHPYWDKNLFRVIFKFLGPSPSHFIY